MTKSIEDISPLEAARLQKNDPHTVIIDVRSKVEYDYVGHPIGAVHVAWKEHPDWLENPNFCRDVDHALESMGGADKSQPLLMICRSGVRSRDAGQKLLDYGYTNVVNVRGRLRRRQGR